MSDGVYRIRIGKRALKDLRAIPVRERRRIERAIEALADDPRPHGGTSLKGRLGDYHRVRVGGYRIIYTIDDRDILVLIVRIGTRQNIYDALLRFLSTLG